MCTFIFYSRQKERHYEIDDKKIRTKPEVSNHLVSYSDLKIPHKQSQIKYKFDCVLLSHWALAEFPYECLQKAGQRTEQTALLGKAYTCKCFFLFEIFFQLLHLPNFIVLLLPGNLLVKNYEPGPLNYEYNFPVSSQGDKLQKWLQHSMLFLSFSRLPELTGLYLMYACFSCVCGTILPLMASELTHRILLAIFV